MQTTEFQNPNLADLDVDFLYHLGLDTSMDLEAMFGDVECVCMGGSPDRAKAFADKLAAEIGAEEPKPIGKTERCLLFKVGRVVVISHGMGMPSMLIFLHELKKLLDYAGAKNYKFMRIGTSGGVGVEPGTVIVADEALNGKLEPQYDQVVLGNTRSWETKLDSGLSEEILSTRGDIRAQIGKTMGTDDFYEGQGRLDGALNPGYNEADKMAYLKQAYDKGVRNIEMEAPAFAAFCLRAGIRGALVNVTLLDRLQGDQVTSTKEQLRQYSDNADEIVLKYLKTQLQK